MVFERVVWELVMFLRQTEKQPVCLRRWISQGLPGFRHGCNSLKPLLWEHEVSSGGDGLSASPGHRKPVWHMDPWRLSLNDWMSAVRYELHSNRNRVKHMYDDLQTMYDNLRMYRALRPSLLESIFPAPIPFSPLMFITGEAGFSSGPASPARRPVDGRSSELFRGWDEFFWAIILQSTSGARGLAWRRIFQANILQSTSGARGLAWRRTFRANILQSTSGARGLAWSELFGRSFCKVLLGPVGWRGVESLLIVC